MCTKTKNDFHVKIERDEDVPLNNNNLFLLVLFCAPQSVSAFALCFPIVSLFLSPVCINISYKSSQTLDDC